MERLESSEGPDRLVGIAETAELAGSSRQAITNLRARDESFPAPLAELRSGPVFREADIRAYLANRGRTTQPAEADDAWLRKSERFDPLELVNLVRSVERALLDEPLNPLPPSGSFVGGGIYCLYYSGPYDPYAAIANEPPRIPVYVGRAVMPDRGASSLAAPGDWPLLFNRLRDHARTLQQAENLRLDDFSCQFLVVDDMWAPRTEALLIAHFRPLWNVVVDGFGLHEPGAGRRAQPRSPWDELHPGRSWASKLGPSRRTRAEILQTVAEHLSKSGPPALSAIPHTGTQAGWNRP